MTTEQETLVKAEEVLLSILQTRRSVPARELIDDARKLATEESEVNLRGGLWSLIARGKVSLTWTGMVRLKAS